MRSKTVPEDAEILKTYDELREFRNSFFNGEFYFLLIVGRPGLSKTWDFEEKCKPYKDRNGQEISVAYYVKGNVSPVVAYELAYFHRNKLLVFDDAERLWADPNGRRLLRDLTECKPRKQVSWQTENKTFGQLNVPKTFFTSSRVCLIMNRLAFGDAHEYDAIVDRAQFVYFDPTPLEIHKNAALWFWDQEIFDFIGEHLNIIDPANFSARAYVKAFERKPKGDWQDFIITRYCRQADEQWVIIVENDPKYKSVDERIDEFARRTRLGRSTYFNIKKALKADGQLQAVEVPHFTLTAEPPGAVDLAEEVKSVLKQEQRRIDQANLKQQEEQEYHDLEDRFFGDADDDDD